MDSARSTGLKTNSFHQVQQIDGIFDPKLKWWQSLGRDSTVEEESVWLHGNRAAVTTLSVGALITESISVSINA